MTVAVAIEVWVSCCLFLLFDLLEMPLISITSVCKGNTALHGLFCDMFDWLMPCSRQTYWIKQSLLVIFENRLHRGLRASQETHGKIEKHCCKINRSYGKALQTWSLPFQLNNSVTDIHLCHRYLSNTRSTESKHLSYRASCVQLALLQSSSLGIASIKHHTCWINLPKDSSCYLKTPKFTKDSPFICFTGWKIVFSTLMQKN